MVKTLSLAIVISKPLLLAFNLWPTSILLAAIAVFPLLRCAPHLISCFFFYQCPSSDPSQLHCVLLQALVNAHVLHFVLLFSPVGQWWGRSSLLIPGGPGGTACSCLGLEVKYLSEVHPDELCGRTVSSLALGNLALSHDFPPPAGSVAFPVLQCCAVPMVIIRTNTSGLQIINQGSERDPLVPIPPPGLWRGGGNYPNVSPSQRGGI